MKPDRLLTEKQDDTGQTLHFFLPAGLRGSVSISFESRIMFIDLYISA